MDSVAAGRLSVKSGRKGTAAGHSQYIDDVDAPAPSPYARPKAKRDDIAARGAGNMPRWAVTPSVFWRAADAHERVNGAAYRELELLLPRKLNHAQRLTLLAEWIQQELGSKHAFQWAMHVPLASDGIEQPHVHLMFSERQADDGIERDPDVYFKRLNSKNPEKGGCRKGWGPRAGETLTRSERKEEIVALRARWEVMVNNHLAAAGVADRIDMRSYSDRGLLEIGIKPERKLAPSESRNPAVREELSEFRAARAELLEASAEVDALVAAESIEVDDARPMTVAEVTEIAAAYLADYRGPTLRVFAIENDEPDAPAAEFVGQSLLCLVANRLFSSDQVFDVLAAAVREHEERLAAIEAANLQRVEAQRQRLAARALQEKEERLRASAMRETEATVEEFKAGYTGSVPVRIIVISDPEALTIAGYVGETLFVDAGLASLASPVEVREAVEAAVRRHHGLNVLRPGDKASLLQSIIAASSSSLSDAWSLITERYPGASMLERAERVFSYAAQAAGELGRAWNAICANLSKCLQTVGLLSRPADVRQIAKELTQRSTEPPPVRVEGGPAPAADGARPVTVPPAAPAGILKEVMALVARLDSVLAGDPRRQEWETLALLDSMPRHFDRSRLEHLRDLLGNDPRELADVDAELRDRLTELERYEAEAALDDDDAWQDQAPL